MSWVRGKRGGGSLRVQGLRIEMGSYRTVLRNCHVTYLKTWDCEHMFEGA